jgi:hypothetical protein
MNRGFLITDIGCWWFLDARCDLSFFLVLLVAKHAIKVTFFMILGS